MEKVIKSAIAKINSLNDELSVDLAEHPNFSIRVSNVLETLANGLSGAIGEGIQTKEVSTGFSPTPLTNVMGEDVRRKEDHIEVKDLAPTKVDKEALRAEADLCFGNFLDRDSADLLKSVEEIVLRAVAKKAGMEVTSTVPEKVTLEFIDEIKDSIKSNNAIELAKSKVEAKPTAKKTPSK